MCIRDRRFSAPCASCAAPWNHCGDIMNTISDNDLILYFYRDGLDAARIGEIDDALFASPDLRARYTRLQQMLHAVDADPAPEPDAQFNERVQHLLQSSVA